MSPKELYAVMFQILTFRDNVSRVLLFFLNGSDKEIRLTGNEGTIYHSRFDLNIDYLL